jgi:hypothetical protein
MRNAHLQTAFDIVVCADRNRPRVCTRYFVWSLERAEMSPTRCVQESSMPDGRTPLLVLAGETRSPGLYLYHCHILEHEDMGMMRNFRVT